MLVQEAFRTLKFLVSTMLEKRGTGELSKHFIIKNDTFFGVQILRKVRQDNGESGGEIIEKSHLVIECNNFYCCSFIRSDLFAT